MKPSLPFRVPLLAGVTALLVLTAASGRAGTMSADPTPPTVDGFDIANYGTVTGNDKWWAENSTGAGSAKGQTFTTGPAAVELRAVCYQVTSSQQAQPTKTYVVRIGTVAGTTFTEIHSETFTQNFAWNGGEYMSWTFDNPPVLLGNTTYATDIGMTGSSSAWQTGIPYINVTANSYPGGQRYSSGQLGVGDAEMHPSTTSDRIFHLDLGIPSGSGLEFVAGNPADDSPDALIPPELVATFSQNLVAGTGNIIIRNLTDGGDTPLPVAGPGISLSDNLLLIETAGVIDWNKSYAIRIDPGALESDGGDIFAGIEDDTTWNFTTAAGDPLLLAISDLKDHINGVTTLTPTEIEERKLEIEAGKQRFDESAATIGAAFDLVTTYDTVVGPLWVSGSPVQGFNRGSVSDQDINWVIYQVMQYIMDEIYSADTLADHEALLDGFTFGSSAHFPGAVAPPADPSNTHTATINGSFDETFGRDTQQWTLPARKPTGTYLAPGTIATVTVPAALVGAGYQVRIGAHSWDLSNRPPVPRLERATLLYNLDAPTTKVASPYGGGIYIEVPKGADAGVVTVDITGAVRSPYFSAKSFHSTTASEWNSTERNHPAPWADFQTDKFMMQVSREWIYAMDGADAVQLMADWDAAMDACNDLMGFPRIRGKETMYIQTDLILRSSVHAPGYPATNVNFNPNGSYNGYQNNYFIRGPQSGAGTEFHEQGHAYFFPKFGGETEANVNLPYVAVRNRAFGMDFDTAFRQSVSYGNFNNVTTDTIDNTAVLWMTSFNFAPREQPMGNWEKAYQPQGHARWVDFARLFGWEGLGAYWNSYMVDDENGTLPPSPTSTDNLLLRLCREGGEDIRPLFHFWGIHPEDPTTLANDVAAEGLTPPVEIYDLLVHYKSLVPADNAAYQAWCQYWYGRAPSIGGFGVEREKTRQYDTTSYWQDNGWDYSGTDPAQADGEIYLEASATRVEDRVQELIDLYYPDGRPVPDNDFAAWIAGYDVGGQTGFSDDADGDGNGNGLENFFGTDPSVFTAGLVSAEWTGNTFTFTHPQNPAPADDLSAPAYRWTTDLQTFHPDGASDGTITVSFAPSLDDPAAGTTTVTATVSGPLPAQLFVDVGVTQVP